MPSSDYSNNFLLYNAEKTKNLVIAVELEGVSTILTSTKLYKRLLYGDPALHYGDPGLVYGGLIEYGDYKSLLDLNGGSLTISQRLEPEQGRGAISTLSLSFIDLNQYMTELISPGVIIDDILGHPVKVYLGYQEISFPDDFLVVFRGRVSSYESQSGRVTLQLSDPNMARRQQIFYIPTTKLAAPITNSSTTVQVVSNGDFPQQIIGPNGSYDSAIKTYLTINDEVIEYPASGFGTNQFTGCIRGARGTTAASANAGSDVSCSIQIEDHAIDMALKLMLSGWNGPYIENISIQNLGYTPDPTITPQTGVILLPTSVDADRDYGISIGDYITVTGASIPGNNQTCRVLQLVASGDVQNNCIVTNGSFSVEANTSATMSVRSQFDTYPAACGVKLPATEVDVKRHQQIKAQFLASEENRMRFYITELQSSCKTFLESQIYLPLSCYSLTRFGRVSMNLTHAPIADDRLQFLNGTNVIDPQNIKPSRGINNRKFFNEIDWQYDFYDGNQVAATTVKTLDTNSLNVIGISSVLPITSYGSRSDLGSSNVIQRRTNFLLSRYKNGAVLLTLQVNWEVGVQIEAGDVVAIQDDGVLQISNFVTGTRNLGVQLFEVTNRDLNMKEGKVSLQVVSGLGAQASDRFATISPSSFIQSGSTSTQLKIDDSYGGKYPGQEILKWQNYEGMRLLIHSLDYSVSATANYVGPVLNAPNTMQVSGLSLAASALPGLVIDVDRYSQSTDPGDQQAVKSVHAFFSPQVAVTGISATSFTVSPSDIGKFQAGFPIIAHTFDWSNKSPETTVASVSAGTYTVYVSESFGFNPVSGYYVSLLGFPDGTASYRYI